MHETIKESVKSLNGTLDEAMEKIKDSHHSLSKDIAAMVQEKVVELEELSGKKYIISLFGTQEPNYKSKWTHTLFIHKKKSVIAFTEDEFKEQHQAKSNSEQKDVDEAVKQLIKICKKAEKTLAKMAYVAGCDTWIKITSDAIEQAVD